MNYTPRHIEFDEDSTIDHIHVQIISYPNKPAVVDEIIPLIDPRVIVTGSHYAIALTGSFCPDNPSVPETDEYLIFISTINGTEESRQEVSDAFQFADAVHEVTNLHLT